MKENKENKDKNKEFESLYKLFSKDVLTFLYRLTQDIEIANDFLQDTFVNFIKTFSNKELPEKSKCKIYLIRTAKNIFINYYRKEKKRKLFLFKKKSSLEDENKMYQDFNLNESNEELIYRELFNHLDFKERTLIILRYNLDMNLDEISKIMNQSTSTIFRKLEKIKKKLLQIAKERKLL